MLEQIHALRDAVKKPDYMCGLLIGAQIFGSPPRPTTWLSREGVAGTPLSGTPGIEGVCLWVPAAGPESRMGG